MERTWTCCASVFNVAEVKRARLKLDVGVCVVLVPFASTVRTLGWMK